MKKCFYAFLFLFTLLLGSCQQGSKKGKPVAKGDRAYGGTLRLSSNEPYKTLFPRGIIDSYSSHISTQIYEGLVRFNAQNLSVIPALAESWEVDTTGTVYTFHLKKGIRFHDDECFPEGKGREVTAEDFKYSFELICTKASDNIAFSFTLKDRLAGSNLAFEESGSGKPTVVPGIKVLDKYTLQLVLEKPFSSFLYVLANPALTVIPQEAVAKYGTKAKIGTGPFRYAADTESPRSIVLVRNDNYHRKDEFGNQLPYLDSIVISVIATKQEELALFKKGELDMIYGLPSESIKDVVQENISAFQQKPPKFILERSPKMETQYYDFNIRNDVFKDKRVRMAFNYAIDRKKIFDDVLHGEGYGPGYHGITPPSFKGYIIDSIHGYTFNPDTARRLMAAAGFRDGNGFPPVTLLLNSGGLRNTVVALEIQKQLKENLNVQLNLKIVSFPEKLELTKDGDYEVCRASWVADYPSPENFLSLYYGRHVPDSIGHPSEYNITRYKNPEFDRLYELAIHTQDREASYKYLMEAEKILMKDVPSIILWYDEGYRLLQYKVRNFQNNPLQYYDCSVVYFISPAQTQP